MDQSRQDKAIKALTAKGVKLPCPRCGNAGFSIVGETMIPLQSDPNSFQIGGPSVPTVLVACNNCGYITQHAQVTLGLAKGD